MRELGRFDKSSLLLAFVERLREHGSWAGETHVQKAAYFLQQLLGVPLECEFVLYKHGPFSFDLRADLTAMQAGEFLRLKPQGQYGPSLVKGSRADQLIREFPEAPKQFANQIDFVAAKWGSKGVRELERLGTALYVTSKGINTVEERAQEIHRLKSHVSIPVAVEAVKEVDQMRTEAASVRA
jgi:hypothetical protein